LLPILFLGIIGLIDDLYQVSAPIRLTLQFILASILTLILSSNSLLAKLFEIEILNSVLSILWIVVITNSINFIDNMDTSSAGNIILISLGIFVIAYQQFQIVISLLSIVVIGSVTAYLIWNKPPAKIYMGDSGTLFLGSILSIMSIRLDFLDEFPIESLTIILALFFVPILDFMVAITSRVIDGVSPFTAGQDHLSHRLVQLGFSKKKSVLILWALSAILYIILSIFFIKIKVR
jgi:UDP-GlcNAc:undecaprenyl-phosphate GlcNAc-1-phosphate transferase